jgi:5'-nucleotidase
MKRMTGMRITLLAAAALVAWGCAGMQAVFEPQFPPLELQIAHINDHHSNLEPQKDFDLRVDGIPTRVDMGGFARLVSVFKGYASQPNLLKIHAGDATTGTLFYTVFKGEADAALMNQVCFDSFTLGNHEFDESDAGLKTFLDFLAGDATCKTPVISANVRPRHGTPLAPRGAQDYFTPYVIKRVGGVEVGIIGLTIKSKTMASSRPLGSTEFLEEVDAARAAVAALKEKGVRHIMLATHLGYANDKNLVAQLPEVDIVIGGDSHSLLGGSALQAYGLTPEGEYPSLVRNADGDPVCVAQAWEYTKVVGLLRARFDERGRISSCTGRLTVPVGDNFKRRDAKGQWVPVGPAAQAVLSAQFTGESVLRVVAEDAPSAALIQGFRARLNASMGEKLGSAPEALCHVRVPGGAATPPCGPRGSDTAQMVAEAFLQAAKRAQLAIQNAGGVRVAVPQGDISFDTAYKVLPFSNLLIEMEMTGAEIVAVLEDAVSNHMDPVSGVLGSNGSHPYAAGLRWDLDLSKPRGQRFGNLEVRDRKSGEWRPLEAGGRYLVVTNDFIASGKDGYLTMGVVYKDTNRWVNTGLYYTQTFIDHIKAQRGQLLKPSAGDYSHKSVIGKDGKRLQ